VHKTTVITPFGLFVFVRMPFVLRNSAQTFQQLMDEVLAGLPFLFIYIDDLLVASKDEAEHERHLREVLQRLEAHGLVLNSEKCVLGAKEVEYLGHVVSAAGVRPLLEKVAAIRNFPQPTNTKSLQRFLRMINFYRRFVHGAAGRLKPLTDVLQGSRKQNLVWTAAFEDAKSCLSNVAEFAHPVEGAELVLAVDASDSDAGAVLQQHLFDKF